MRDMHEVIGTSWTIEAKGQHLYVTNAKSAASMSTTDPAYHLPGKDKASPWYVPAYVLKALRDLAGRAERAVEHAKPAVIPASGPARAVPATLPTVLHVYDYNLETAEGRAGYDKLRDDLHALGLRKTAGMVDYKHWDSVIRPLGGRTILLETQYLFSDQWNTAAATGTGPGLRVFDWTDNTKGRGYWLEPTDDMRNARRVRHVCGYCGNQHDILTEVPPEGAWCTACLGSEHLEEKDLPLLRMRPAGVERWDRQLLAEVPAWLMDRYHIEQRHARTRRWEQAKRDKLAKLQQDIANAQTEYDAFKWLIDHDMAFDNVIFYDHTGTFCFGWQKPFTKEQAEVLEVNLARFPYKYEIKTA